MTARAQPAEGELALSGRARPAPWEVATGVAAVAAAAAAVWVTLDAQFLAHPGWLAAQKADFILGPVFIGLYWRRRRPASRFGPLLIGFGFLGAVYVLQSSSDPRLFGAGLVWENVIYLATLGLILTFPSGRLDGWAPRLILLGGLVLAALPATVIDFVLPHTGAGGSISSCRAACPRNALAFTSQPDLARHLSDVFRAGAIAVAFATGALLTWQLATGTPPRRRALAIGTPMALLFLALQVAYQALTLVAPGAVEAQDVVRWAFAGARSLIWYGFLAALIAAQLFAARALQRLVQRSLWRPSREELEAMLRGPLGDPALRIAFWEPATSRWPPPAGPGQAVAVVDRGDGSSPVAILHDRQLDDDPELVETAGVLALLAAEAAELDKGWNDAVHELRRSRARIVRVGDDERRRLERNLHDGVQQRIVVLHIELGLARDLADGGSVLRRRLDSIAGSLDDALEELREVSHGLYPPLLSSVGLVAALEAALGRSDPPVPLTATGIARHSPELESAIYYCCTEAVQNATKHAGPRAHLDVTLHEGDGELSFSVTDDGAGFDPAAPSDGAGLQNIRDRVGALGGRLDVVSAVGRGTSVSARIPLGGADRVSRTRPTARPR